MKSLRLIIAFLCLSGALFAQDLAVRDLTVEHKKNPVGIDITQPRFSWKIIGTGYESLCKLPILSELPKARNLQLPILYGNQGK